MKPRPHLAAQENFAIVYQIHIRAVADEQACNHMVVKVHHNLENHRSMAHEHPVAHLLKLSNQRTFDFERMLTEDYGMVVPADTNTYYFR